MDIKITSKLTSTQRNRLVRHIERDLEREFDPKPFRKVGRNTYRAVGVAENETEQPYFSDVHSVARHMMVVAGTAFDYEVV